MPKSRAPRKAYRPRLVDAPVTAGLVETFRAAAIDCELKLRLRTPGVETFNELGDIFDIVGSLLSERIADDRHPDTIALRSAALAMIAAGKRLRDDVVRFYDHECDAVQRGLEVIVRRVHELKVTDMYLRDRKVRADRVLASLAPSTTTEESSTC